MRYVDTKSIVQVVGHIWQPGVGPCAQVYNLSSYDINNILESAEWARGKGREKKITRTDVALWLTTAAGDFREIADFRADLEVEGENIAFDWEDEESEIIYNDCMFPAED